MKEVLSPVSAMTPVLLTQDKQPLLDAVEYLMKHAKNKGVAAEVGTRVDVGFSVSVRMGEVETLEFHRDRGIGITVYCGQRKGSANTNDLQQASLDVTFEAAWNIAQMTSEDPYAGLADPDRMAYNYPELELAYPWAITPEEAITQAIACETRARDYDTRITNSEGASISTVQSYRVYGNTHGFIGHYASSSHSASCSLVAQLNDQMQRDYYYSSVRDPKKMLSLDIIADRAAERTVARLGARSLSTQKLPILFAPEVARGLLGHFLSAVSGGNLYRRSSFLLDQLGKQVFAPFVTLREEPLEKGGLGSAPFDSEGVRTEARDFVRDGQLCSYILGSYSARKLGMKSTGNAGGIHNLYITPGNENQAQLLKRMGKGLLVTEVMGQGVNIVTGDYSRGASGFWIENGQIQFPVEGITIAGNLRDMFLHLVTVGNDVDHRSHLHTGSLLMDSMTIAGD